MNKFLFDLHNDENDDDDDDFDDKDYDKVGDDDDDDYDAILPTSFYLILICDIDDFLQHLAFLNKFLDLLYSS